MTRRSTAGVMAAACSLVVSIGACGGAATSSRSTTISQPESSGDEAPVEALRVSVANAFFEITPTVAQCLIAYPESTIAVGVEFEASGGVQSVDVRPRDWPEATPGLETSIEIDDSARGCVERALRTMRIEPFEGPSFVVSYPFHGPG